MPSVSGRVGLVLLILMSVAVGASAAQQAERPVESERPSQAFIFLGLHGGMFDQMKRFEQPLNVRLITIPDEEIGKSSADLSGVCAIFLQHVRLENPDGYRKLILLARDKNPGLRVFTLSGAGALRLLLAACRASRYAASKLA